jgi:NitT/TauT family transport system substrate-binding protein
MTPAVAGIAGVVALAAACGNPNEGKRKEIVMTQVWKSSSAVLALGILFTAPAQAADTVRIIDSQRMSFSHMALHNAQAEGFFKKHNLDAIITFAAGGAETLQALITGSADIAFGVGTLSVVGAVAKGAPVTIVGNVMRGTSDIYFYVPKDSPIKTLKDLDGKELVYSRPGSTTHLLVQFLARDLDIKPKLVSVGGMAASRTQVMSGQVASGWSAFPVNYDLVRKGEIRTIGSGADAKGLANLTIRVVAANSDWVKKNPDVARRTMEALWQGLKFTYEGGDKAFKHYAEKWKLDLEDAKAAPKFTPFEQVTFWPLGDMDLVYKLAQEFKQIDKPLTEEQKKSLVTVVYDPQKK